MEFRCLRYAGRDILIKVEPEKNPPCVPAIYNDGTLHLNMLFYRSLQVVNPPTLLVAEKSHPTQLGSKSILHRNRFFSRPEGLSQA